MLNHSKVMTIVATLAATGAAFAQDADPKIDINGDGFYSFPEVSTIYPEITDEMFTTMDTTGDGLLDMAEVMAAQEAGLLPMAEKPLGLQHQNG